MFPAFILYFQQSLYYILASKAARRITDFFDQVEAFTGEIDVSDPDDWESL